MSTRLTALLLLLLIGSNLAWLGAHWGRRDPAPTPATEAPELAALRQRVARLESELTQAQATKTPTEASGRRRAKRPPRPDPKADQRAARFRAQQAANKQVQTWKAAVLQIQDAGAREVALQKIEAAIRGTDPALAAAALAVLARLRDAAYDKSRFRAAVRARLDDPDDQVRRAALYAILQVQPDASDQQRVLDVLAKHPDQPGSFIVGAWMAKSRVEGRLAKLYAQSFAGENPRQLSQTANQLRGMWVDAEVEQAMVEAFQRTGRRNRGLWEMILGQARPTRTPRVKVVFELLKESPSAWQSLDRALLGNNLDPSARPLAAELAMTTLIDAPHAGTRRLCLKVLDQIGSARQATRLRAFSTNHLVDAALRSRASQILAKIEKR